MKGNRFLAAMGVFAALAIGLALAAPAVGEDKPGDCVDQKVCAEKLRFGSEAFGRGQYREAKGYFRQAVQADPTSAKAWSFYDLSVMYEVAQQVQNAGSVQVSGAPVPGAVKAGAGASSGQAAQPPAEPPKEETPPVSAVPVIPQDEGC